ncbi:uncharacterized protein LOC142581963 isoform X2 [Dermacentor variabilis]|uniref:uncharacterized protein LOC142581963 isoform X2 n=1 Tax=Dermacentor variabilis TaxID=34621 RepID=UPI003F5C7A7B
MSTWAAARLYTLHCFLHQFVFGLLLDAGDVRLGTTGTAATALDRHARNDYAPTLPTRIFDYQLHQLTGTCAYPSAVERHSESAQSAAIYAFHKGPPVTGHGGTVDMRFTNCPFVYILQVPPSQADYPMAGDCYSLADLHFLTGSRMTLKNERHIRFSPFRREEAYLA